jgi:hypothetical protein
MAESSSSETSSPHRWVKRTPRAHRVWVRFSDEELAALKAKAKEAGLPISSLLREHVGAVTIRDREAERQRNVTLNRLNANLNMIAKWVNTWKDRADAFRVTERLDAVQDEVMRLIETWEGKSGDRGVFQARQRPRRPRR